MFKFLALRLGMVLPVVFAAVLVWDGLNFAAPLAMVLGCAVSLYKIRLWQRIFASMEGGGKSSGRYVLIFVLVFVLTLGLLTVFAIADLRLLMGFGGGYLLLTLIITANALTEGLNITHNKWGEKTIEN